MSRLALVTGGAGFIGSHLVDALLDHDWRVRVLDDFSTGSYDNISHLVGRTGFELVEGSILDPAAVEPSAAGADVIFHLAAAVGVQLIVDQPLRSLETNIKGTELVLEVARRFKAKVLLTSTSEIYGKSMNGPFREEDDRLLGSTRTLRWSYSTSKAVDEILAFSYHRELGLPTLVARLFNTVGPRQTGNYGMVLPRFISQAISGSPLTIYGDGEQSRTFTYVGDVVEAMLRLVETPAAEGDAFNVAGNEEVTINELARRVIELTGTRSRTVHIPFEEVYGKGFEDMRRRVADTSRLERTISYRCETPLDEAIKRMIEYDRGRTRQDGAAGAAQLDHAAFENS
jgi:UDP-glucose 4-epimerase